MFEAWVPAPKSLKGGGRIHRYRTGKKGEKVRGFDREGRHWKRLLYRRLKRQGRATPTQQSRMLEHIEHRGLGYTRERCYCLLEDL